MSSYTGKQLSYCAYKSRATVYKTEQIFHLSVIKPVLSK